MRLLVSLLVVAALGCTAPDPEAPAPAPDEPIADEPVPAPPAPEAKAASDAGAAEPRKAKVLLLGLDGLDPGLVRKWTADGSMPNLAKLIDRGLMTEIDCVVGMSSPVVWTTVATGEAPEDHGITGFRIEEDPVNSSHRRRPTFWNILPTQDVDVATIGWMVTWPAEQDVGIVVSDRAWWGRFNGDVSPAGVVDPLHHIPHIKRDEVLEMFTSHDFDDEWKQLPEDDPRYAVHYLLRKRLLNIFRRDTVYAGIAREIASEHDLDLLALYLQGTDYVGHGFWQWFEPEPFRKSGWDIPDEQVEALGTIVPAYYRYVDSLVGSVLPVVDEDALVILLSDHGFQASTAFRHDQEHSLESRFLSGNHRKKATLILSGPQVRKNAQPEGPVTHFDILPTLLFALDLPRARDHQGRPLTELFAPEFARSRAESTVDTYVTDADVADRPVVRGELDQKVVEELRSLGYIR